MRLSFAGAWLVLALPLSAALDFNSGNFGTVGQSNTIFLFTPTGGTGPYSFAFAPGATLIPNFRVVNAPELPSFANTSQKGGLVGLPLTAGPQSTTIRLTDTSNGVFVDKVVSFTVQPVNLSGFGPNYYAVGDTVHQRFWPVGGTPPYSYTLSGTLPPGLSLSTEASTGAALVSGTILNTANTATTAATNQYNFTITISDSAGHSLGRGYGMAVSALQLLVGGSPLNEGANRNLPNATVGQAYSQQISVLGGTPPYTFSLPFLNALPNTLTLSSNGSGALISGTPTGANFFGNFTLTVTDSAVPQHRTTVRLSMKILPAIPAPLSFSTSSLADSPVGSNFTWGVYATGGLPPYTFDIDPATPVPSGLVMVQGPEASPENFDPQPGYLRAVVQTPGTYTFNVRVTDSVGNRATRAYTLKVPPMSVNYIFASNVVGSGPLSDLTLGLPYSRALIPIGGTPPYTVTPTNYIQGGSIPAGLTVDNNVVLSGTPQEDGINLPLNYNLNDSAGNHFDLPGNVTIASSTSPGLALSGGDFGVVQLGSQFITSLTASGSAQTPPTFAVSLVSGSLPPGLRLLTGSDFNNGGNATIAAQLAGIPSTPGVYTFVYRVVDGLGQVGQRSIKLRVSGMAIVNTGFAPGQVGVPYNQTIDVRGGTPPYTFSLTAGNLPPNLSLNSNTGAISGTPTSSNSSGITIQVQDSAGDILLRSFTLTIYPIQITGPDVLPNGVLGHPYSYTFTTNPSGAYTFTASGLPAGLSINSGSGVLAGTPQGTGSFTVTITAFNNATAAVVVRAFTMFVSSQQLATLLNGLPTSEVDIGGVPTAYLGDFAAGSNLVLTPNVAGGTPPYTISLVSSTLPPGLALAIGSTYQGTSNFNRWVIAGVPTTPGLYTFTLRYADSSGITEDRLLAMNITALGLSTTNPGIAIVNQPYSAQLYGTGGNGSYTFAVATDIQNNLMPPGLSLSATGTISGTPTSSGVFGVTLQLTSGASTRRVGITLTINATSDNRRIDVSFGGAAPVYLSIGRGSASDNFLTPTGGAGTHSWSVVSGSLPPGMQMFSGASLPPGLTPPMALLAGSPTTAGTYHFRIRVDDSTGNFGIRDAVWVVTPLRSGPPNVKVTASMNLPPGQVGSLYSFTVSAMSAGPGLTFTMETGSLLPPGMTFSPTGVLSGTPTAAGNFILVWHMTDNSGNYLQQSRAINIFPASQPKGINPTLGSGTQLPSATLSAAYSFTLNDLIAPGYGNPPFTWTLNDGALPPGISIVPGSGPASPTLSGTAATTGSYTFSLLATDAAGRQLLIKNFVLVVSVFGVAPTAGALPPAVAGTSYQTAFSASGGTPPYTFATTYYSDMPAGLSLSPDGVLSGTPNIAGPFVLYIAANDSANQTFLQWYTLNVSPAGTVMPAFTLTPSSINITYTAGDPAPAPIPISVGSTSTVLSYSISNGASSWLSASAAGGVTPGAPNAIITPGGLAAGSYNGTLTFTSAAASNSPANLPVTLTVVNAVVCTYSLSPTADTILAGGGSKSFGIATSSSSCAWAVDTAGLPGWIHITGPSSGNGNGSVNLSVDANNPPAGQRIGVVAVNGIGYTLTQFGSSCSFDLATPTVNIGAAGGLGPIGVIASAASCPWSVAQVDPWISVTATAPSPAKGTGSATVKFQANTSPGSRTGSITIAGQTLTVNQAGVGCTFSLNSAGTTVSSAGGPASFNVTVPAGCTWTADTGPSWIAATSGSPGNGNGTVNLSIAANSTTGLRQAAVKVAGQSFTVSQGGVPCDLTVSANNPVQPMAGGTGSVTIGTGSSCGWTATTNGASWVVPGASSGTGSGTVNFTVASNGTGAARNASLIVNGQPITISQNGPVCGYSLQAASANMPGTGGTGTVGVITAAGCGPWTGTSNAPTWLHFTGLASDTGPDTTSYTVDANLTGADRLGTLTIAGQTLTVTQAAQPCSVSLSSTSLGPVGEFGGGPFQFTYTTAPAACSVNVQSYSSWIAVGGGAGGTVQFAVAANTYAAARSGTIKVGDQSFTVTQAASSCGYTLTSFGATFGQAGGSGTVPMNFSPGACGPPAVVVNGPAGMVTLGAVTGGAGSATPNNYTENYSVSTYLSFINYVQTTQLVVNGQIYTVKQTSW